VFRINDVHSQAPSPSPSELSPEELATVRLFQENTPSVVNVVNIGARQGVWSMDIERHGLCTCSLRAQSVCLSVCLSVLSPPTACAPAHSFAQQHL
jgi:hypothetical protein